MHVFFLLVTLAISYVIYRNIRYSFLHIPSVHVYRSPCNLRIKENIFSIVGVTLAANRTKPHKRHTLSLGHNTVSVAHDWPISGSLKLFV